ncbi:MAG: hypothetical protein ABIF10_02695 [Candidatus Woesearchaeota archaeon]
MKAAFFTILAVVLAALFVGTFAFYVRYDQSSAMDSVEMRLNTMNEFVKSVKKDLDRALYISSFRAFLSLVDNIGVTGNFLDDTTSDFTAALINGTVGNESVSLMLNQTFIDWTAKMELLAREIDLNISLNIVNVSMQQSSPWLVSVTATINMSLVDKKQTASWRTVFTASASLPVEGFEDPVYLIGSNGKIVRPIVKSNVTSWNITSLNDHLEKKTYAANPLAPSFLSRLEGDLSGHAYGIETLVDTNELYIYGEEILNKSSVDYLYFGSISTTNYKIANITDKGNDFFLLDSQHVGFYNVLGYNYTG